jgi:Flp pilus assembly protein TadG
VTPCWTLIAGIAQAVATTLGGVLWPTRLTMRKHVRRRRGQPGQAMAELALVAPMLLLLVVVGLDFGRAFLVHNALTNSVREGARYGITHPSDATGMRSRVQAELSGATVSVANSEIHVLWAPASPAGSGCGGVTETEALATYQANKACYPYAKVRIDYTYVPMTPLAGQFMGGGANLHAAVTMGIE